MVGTKLIIQRVVMHKPIEFYRIGRAVGSLVVMLMVGSYAAPTLAQQQSTRNLETAPLPNSEEFKTTTLQLISIVGRQE